jgi:hypothetical protein
MLLFLPFAFAGICDDSVGGDFIAVGESRTYTIDGDSYEVNNFRVAPDGRAKLIVGINGANEVTEALGEDDKSILSNSKIEIAVEETYISPEVNKTKFCLLRPIQETSSSCQQKPSEQERNACYFDILECDKITYSRSRDNCYNYKASQENDISFCDLISDSSLIASCKSHLQKDICNDNYIRNSAVIVDTGQSIEIIEDTLRTSQTKTYQLVGQDLEVGVSIIQEGTLKAQIKIEGYGPTLGEGHLIETSTYPYYEDVGIAVEEINTAESKVRFCLFKEKVDYDYQQCESMESDAKKDACYMNLVNAGDYSICDKISNQYLRQSCESLANQGSEPTQNCNDGVLGIGETDVDCGGSCDDCEEGRFCDTDNDCQTGLVCEIGICKTEESPDTTPTEPEPIVSPPETEMPPIQEETCNGCKIETTCYPIGYRKEAKFCSETNEFVSQKEEETSCDNNFECKSNLCVDDKCLSGSLFQKIMSWFKNLFG